MWNKIRGKYYYIKDKYFNWYEFKWSLWSLCTYFKIVITMRPWDYAFVLIMMKFQLKILRKTIEDGNEWKSHKKIKLKDIDRACEILAHIEDGCYYIDFYENKLGKINHDIAWVNTGDEYKIELKSKENIKEGIKRRKIYKLSDALEESEWGELINILRDGDYVKKRREFKGGLRSWWN